VDDGERRPQLVGGNRDEVALHTIDVSQLVERALELRIAVALVDEDGCDPSERRQ
jgi:hypothetical protein